MRRNSKFAVIVILLAAIAGTTAGETHTNSGFQKLKSLVGDWEGKHEDGSLAKSHIQAVVSGTAIMETLTMSGMEDMISIFSADGDSVAMIHYCPTNNQPKMRSKPGPGPIKELDFSFEGAGNLASPTTGHQDRLVIRFTDENHMTESWTWKQNAQVTEMNIQFVRIGKKKN